MRSSLADSINRGFESPNRKVAAAAPGKFRAAAKRPMHKKLLIFGIASTTFSSLAFLILLTSGSTTVGTPIPEAAKVDTVNIIVPTGPVVRGTRLDKVAFKEVLWPRTELPENPIYKFSEVSEMYARADLPPMQPFGFANVSKDQPAPKLPSLLPPGHRAITIPVDATAGVEGWAQPGVHVDVLVSYKDRADQTEKTQIAVEDAVVLSFNGELRPRKGMPGNEEERPEDLLVPRAATVTLGVPVKDALKIRTVQMLGTVSLVLRNTDDLTRANEATYSASELRGAPPQSARPPRVAPPKPAPTTPAAPQVQEPDGFARFVDPRTGSPVELELHDRRWKPSSEGE